MEKQAEILLDAYLKTSDKSTFTWLKGRSYSDAFVICVGAGPWKIRRRKQIQGMALDALNGRDLSLVEDVDWYPLSWQNKYVNTLAKNLREEHRDMEKFCEQIKLYRKCARHLLYEFADVPKGSKVLSLFCRDSLNVQAFPIDRHVKAKLEELGLPVDEEEMIKICEKAKLNPKKVATAFVRDAGDVDNPDWQVRTSRR